MTEKALLDEILKLPAPARLSLLERIWESLAANPEQVPVPEWHIAELERRLADPDPEHVSWDEVKARLSSKLSG